MTAGIFVVLSHGGVSRTVQFTIALYDAYLCSFHWVRAMCCAIYWWCTFMLLLSQFSAAVHFDECAEPLGTLQQIASGSDSMSVSLTIQKLNVENGEHLTAVVSIVNECYRGNRNWTNESALVRGERINSQKLASVLEHMTVLVAVAKSEDQKEKVIGCVKTGVVESTVVGPLSSPAGYIGMFAVHPDSGGRGIGNKLLAAAEDFCSAHGVSEMVLDVLDHRADIMAWYNRKGYQTLSSMCVPARDVITSGGEELLIECNFVRMSKKMNRT